MRFHPHNYQRDAIAFIHDVPQCALFLDMGLGKTVIALTAFAELQDEAEAERCLVIAPKKVAESTWAAEAGKWDHLKHLRVAVCLGPEAKRLSALRSDADVYVISRDLFVWLTEQKEFAGKFDFVILDELTSFKNSASKRFKAFRRFRRCGPRIVGLTGTPAPNGLQDLWAQMCCVDGGQTFGPFKGRFLDTYFSTFWKNNIRIRITPKPGAEDAIYEKLATNCLTMRAEDWLELPEKIEQTVRVALSAETMERYRAFERERVLYAASLLEDDDNPAAVAANAAGLCNKLQQFASGAVYDDNGVPIPIHAEKMEALDELVETAHASGESVLVFYQFRHEWDRFWPMAEAHGWRARLYVGDADLRDWNAGKLDVLFAHPAATAYGLNMQEGGHVIIWYGTGFDAELYLQGNARLHRQGQQKPTRIYRLVAADTVEEYAAEAVSGKVQRQSAMLDFLKTKISHEKEVR